MIRPRRIRAGVGSILIGLVILTIPAGQWLAATYLMGPCLASPTCTALVADAP